MTSGKTTGTDPGKKQRPSLSYLDLFEVPPGNTLLHVNYDSHGAGEWLRNSRSMMPSQKFPG